MRALLIFALACSGAVTAPEGNGSEQTSTEQAVDPLATDPCSVLTAAADSTQGGGTPPSVAGEDTPSDLDGMAAALPTESAGFTRSEMSTWARGAAGHWSPSVLAFYSDEANSRVAVQVTDLVHVCSCGSGMGETLRGRRLADDSGSSALEIAGHPAARNSTSSTPAEIEVWLNDRCSVRVWAAPHEALERLAGTFDWSALSAACPAR